MDWTSPHFLWLALPAALLLWLGARHSLAHLSGRQRTALWLLRAGLLGLLIVALAGPRWSRPATGTSVLLLVDDSASVSERARQAARLFGEQVAAARGGKDQWGAAGFAEGVSLWQPLGVSGRDLPAWPSLPSRGATGMAQALDFAAAALPPSGHRRVVLLSDGRDTRGGALEAARRLTEGGAELWAVPLPSADAPEVLVEAVILPRRARVGEPVDLSARVRANRAGEARLKVYQNQFLVAERTVQLTAGVQEITVPNLHPEGSFVAYEVEVSAAADTSAENNRATATISLRGEPRVLMVDAQEAQLRPLAEALRREKISVETRGLAGTPRTLEDLQQFDLLMLSDVSALRLAREQMELYRRWVQELGGGFVMLGGENSFGVGGFYRTPIETMLPVRMEQDDRQDTPSVALLVVLDRSGSMTAQVAGQTKMSLADQGAVFAMGALQSKDTFGVMSVDTRVHNVVPLAPLTSRATAEQKILSITAGGGGIYIYTSLAECFQQLRDVPARIKHVILFSDAADAEEKAAGERSDGARSGGHALDLASAMVAAKITISVVGLGSEQDQDTAFLRQLAERGNGRFYLTSDATTLPQIFSTETMRVAQSSLIEEPFQAVPTGAHRLLGGLDWAQAPLLLGYNATKLKPTAEMLLATERGEPLLATWRYGLGQAAAFTSDAKSRWAAEWMGWPGYGKFWAQVVRGLMRKSEASAWQVSSREVGEELQVDVEAATPTGTFRNGLPVQVQALLPDGQTESVAATQIAPGQYRARVPLPKEGTTVLSVSSPQLPEGTYTFGHTRSYPAEYAGMGTDEAFLRELAAAGRGRFAPTASEVFASTGTPARVPQELTGWLLTAFLLLLPVEIWLRRRAWAA